MKVVKYVHTLFMLLALWLINGYSLTAFAQQNIGVFIDDLKKETELQNASVSLSVLDAQTGTVVCEYNSKLSLSPASTMKVLTTASALQLLGKDFHYETAI